MDRKSSPALKTPTVGEKETLADSTVIEIEASPKASSNGLEAIDLDIKNLEGTPELKHKRSVSESVIPKEGRRSSTRRYSLDLGPTTAQDHAALAAENEKKRRTSEKIFKIMLIFVILVVIGLITGLMVGWELGYFNKQDGFSAPGSPVPAMPPKGKRRKNDISAEEQQIYDDLEALMYKYRHESEEEDGEAGMFGNDTLLVHVDSVAEIFRELEFHWDPAVLSILKSEQKTIDFSMMKLIFKTLSTIKEQEADIEYLFKTFSNAESGTITQSSLATALRHLNIRESSEKLALLFAFAHEQSFLKLVLNEQMHGESAGSFADVRPINFAEFKRTFIRSNFLINQ